MSHGIDINGVLLHVTTNSIKRAPVHITHHSPLFSLQANNGVITMGPSADDTPVRPSLRPYTVPRVDC